jgi:hypothetical protein
MQRMHCCRMDAAVARLSTFERYWRSIELQPITPPWAVLRTLTQFKLQALSLLFKVSISSFPSPHHFLM